MICPQAHDDRALLLAEVERLHGLLKCLSRNEAEQVSRLIHERNELLDELERLRGATQAEVEKLRAALIEWDALIKHQFSGSREAMSDMQAAALNTKRVLDELDARHI